MAQFEDTLGQLRAAGEATRLRAVLLLREGEMTVTELTDILGQSQPRVSRHLKVLADAGLVERFQEGSWVFYRLADREARALLGALTMDPDLALLPEDAAALSRVRDRRAEAAAAYFAEHAEAWADLRTRLIADEEVEATLRDLASGNEGDPLGEGLFVDLGTGTGEMLRVFRDHYRAAIGYDISTEMLAIARARILEWGLAEAQVRRVDFLTTKVEVEASIVCLHHVLHFLPTPEAAIAAAARMLAPGGRVLIADFAPHDHEDLRETHAHRRLGFSTAEVAAWAGRQGLRLDREIHLAPPREGGLETVVWRLTLEGPAGGPTIN